MQSAIFEIFTEVNFVAIVLIFDPKKATQIRRHSRLKHPPPLCLNSPIPQTSFKPIPFPEKALTAKSKLKT